MFLGNDSAKGDHYKTLEGAEPHRERERKVMITTPFLAPMLLQIGQMAFLC